MKFERFSCALGYTWAFKVFRDHHTEINQIYWSFAPVDGYARHKGRHANVGETPQSLFYATGPDVHRLAHTVSAWDKDFKLMGNWLRASCVVAASGYLEIYLKKVASLALKSDPGVRYSKPRSIDGVAWLKIGIEENHNETTVNLIKGTWNSRVAHYKKLFGSAPRLLNDSIRALEELRLFRNGVGHTFGRNANHFQLIEFNPEPMKKIKDEKLKEWLALVYDIAKAVDDHLGINHVGEFEAILYYHGWKNKNKFKGTSDVAFRKELSGFVKHGTGSDYCTDLIKYYDSAK